METTYTFNCEYCNKVVERAIRQRQEIKRRYKNSKRLHQFCSKKCGARYYDTRLSIKCGWCQKDIIKRQQEINDSKSGLVFCGSSCSASFNNTQKRKSRRSKCEKMLFDLLVSEFSTLEIFPNDKTLLNGYEVDIAIPSLSLAIEWNGIVHFKPIYGLAKLTDIQKRDREKATIAQQKCVNLIVIPDLVSSEKYVKEAFQCVAKIVRTLL